ncbi:MAG: hypothetical protein L6R42_006369 [Xanthoria sp. 1 TBL-2021]|nr:MAG: hypothetical protein L6R42_006369 [Xanthoria sp. 1 TBL-2021]
MSDLATLEVAIYHPLDRTNYLNPDTWVLYIDDPATQESLHRIVYQAGDTSRHATVEARYGCRPRELPRYKERILVGYMDKDNMAKARNEIQGVEVFRNAGSQTWVMDVLEVLREKGYVRLGWKGMEWLRDLRRG